jgi:hypothetical protein
VHPASRWLASESAHVEGECGEHDLHVFEALRSMDEILVANFHVLDEVTETEHVDLVVGDEAWDLDHFLHENPERKRAAYAWLTDFVGHLPMPEGGAREAALTADYNAQMIEQIDRYPRLRDRALFVGDVDDVVSDPFGPGLPSIREWTRAHYAFPGYVTGFVPIDPRDRSGIRDELGWAPGEPVCLVTAGGSGVGLPLMRRVVAALPRARQRVPGLLVVVAGPRVDVRALPAAPGLRRHFEQNRHVAHRLLRYRAGRRLDWAELDPDVLAEAIADEIGREVDPLPVDPGGAARAAAHLVELL